MSNENPYPSVRRCKFGALTDNRCTNEATWICVLHGKMYEMWFCDEHKPDISGEGHTIVYCGHRSAALVAQSFRAEIQPNGDVWIHSGKMYYEDCFTIIIPRDKRIELASLLGRDEMRDAIVIGQYEIRHWDTDSFWIEHESGEGMHCTAKRLADCIDVFYRESF